MENLLSVNTILFTFLGYQMSYIEFFGTIFNVWCVWLVAKNNILTWPVGIVGIVLFLFLFWQIRLYSDFIEQIYYFVMSIYGWWMWTNPGKTRKAEKENELKISRSSKNVGIAYFVAILIATAVMGYIMSNIDVYFPQYFPEPASLPYPDAFTTVMSFAATILMAKKKIECWYLWVLVDIIGIALYFEKDVVFISILYVAFLMLAVKGYLNWKKEIQNYEKEELHKGAGDRKVYATA